MKREDRGARVVRLDFGIPERRDVAVVPVAKPEDEDRRDEDGARELQPIEPAIVPQRPELLAHCARRARQRRLCRAELRARPSGELLGEWSQHGENP